MPLLLHGTTLWRARQIEANGPDAVRCGEDGFSTYLKEGPFLFGPVEHYARRKEASDEGGPAILEIDVPEEIIALAESPWFPRTQGLVQFNFGAGLEELLAAWPRLWKQIRLLGNP